MTNKRAIVMLQNELACVRNLDCERDECRDCRLVMPEHEITEALEMAIQALEGGVLSPEKGKNRLAEDEGLTQEEIDKCLEELDFVQPHKKIGVNLDLEPCGDAVSREMALKEAYWIVCEAGRFKVIQEETLLGLPSVQPERKSGWWFSDTYIGCEGEQIPVVRCSECRSAQPHGYHAKFCPDCGAKMKGGE